MAKFDMNAMLKQAQQMQAQMLEAQEQAKQEIVEASAGGGMVTVKANGGGELVEIRIDPKAIDPTIRDARGHRDGSRERGTPLRKRAGRVEDPRPDARPRRARPARDVEAATGFSLSPGLKPGDRLRPVTACHRGHPRPTSPGRYPRAHARRA